MLTIFDNNKKNKICLKINQKTEINSFVAASVFLRTYKRLLFKQRF